MKKNNLIIWGTILVSFAIGIYFYFKMPEQMASHWNEKGEVEGYLPKFWGLFLMPIISVACLLLFLFIPKIDPLKANIQKFRKYFDRFITIFMLFFLYIYMLTILWNLGFKFNMAYLMPPALSILFYYCGVLIENSKRNWFIGIKTPWTLSNEVVWEKTHKIGGKLFKAAAIISLIGLFFADYVFYFLIIPISFAGIYSIIYSYLEYQKLS